MQHEIEKVKDKVINQTLVINAVLLGLAVCASVFRWFSIGWQHIYLAHTIIYLAILTTTILRRRISTYLKIHVFAISCFILSIAGLISFAHYSGIFLIFVSISYIAVLERRKMALLYVFVFILVYIPIGWAIINQKIVLGTDLNVYSQNPYTWVTWLVIALAVLLIIIYGLGQYYTELQNIVKQKEVFYDLIERYLVI